MTATTYTHTPEANRSTSFGKRLSRFFAAFAEAQERHAAKQVARVLSVYDDGYLNSLGYTPAEIARLRGRRAR